VGATVIAGTAGWAESFSKTLMVGDTDQALAAAADHGLAALLVRDDGSTLHTPAWSAYAVDPSPTGAPR
jgi:thiamine biosynthesis lipoprotein ApbE